MHMGNPLPLVSEWKMHIIKLDHLKDSQCNQWDSATQPSSADHQNLGELPLLVVSNRTRVQELLRRHDLNPCGSHYWIQLMMTHGMASLDIPTLACTGYGSQIKGTRDGAHTIGRYGVKIVDVRSRFCKKIG